MKQYNIGYSSSGRAIRWQRAQNATVPAVLPTHASKTRINMMLGGSVASTYLRRNGNIQAPTTSTAFGAIVNRDLAFGSAGGGAERSNIAMQEVITFNFNLTPAQFDRVESYLAIKYGVTLGLNGTAVDDYFNSTGAVVYDASSHAGYTYDIGGIGRDDASALSQLKSHSTNGPGNGNFADIVTIANGNFATPAAMTTNSSFFIWGHNGAPTLNTGVVVNYPTDNAETIEAIFQRVWKSEETGSVGSLILEFDLSTVIGVGGVPGGNDLANLRLFVDEDGDFSIGATSIAPISYNNITGIAYFQHDFQPFLASQMTPLRGFFFTLGTTDITTTPLPVLLTDFDVENQDCSNLITWNTNAELNSAFFMLERSYNTTHWTQIAKVNGAGNSSTPLDYIWRDNAFETNGNVYYRLMQEDLDGKTTLLKTESVNCFCDQNSEPILYPNPAANILMVESVSAGTLHLLDIQGKEIAYSKSRLDKQCSL
ncbi:MAG: hypothetical protein ACI837_000921 [Crocinitomicaceae bacterium]|jgi:hypothetical protein